jgi:hypothetical protein
MDSARPAHRVIPHPGPIRLETTDLVFFIDETGAESLDDPSFPVFGFGCCAVTGENYQHAVFRPWREMKTTFFGGVQSPMHASGGPVPDAGQLTALSEFFARDGYFRLGAVVKRSTSISGMDDYHDAASAVLQMLIGRVVQAILPTRVVLVFEDSERGRPLILKHFGSLKIDSHGPRGTEPLPILQCFEAKSMNEPGLEVADFIAHAASTQARAHEAGAHGWRLDFHSIFQAAPAGLARYADVHKAHKIAVPLQPGRIPGATYIELATEKLGPDPNRDPVGTRHRPNKPK